MIPDWISHYWIQWAFGIIGGVLVALYNSLRKKVKQQREESEAIKNGMKALLSRQVVSDCEAAIRDGYASIQYKNAMKEVYACYHALGGNGAVTQLFNSFMTLPTVLKEEEQHDAD